MDSCGLIWTHPKSKNYHQTCLWETMAYLTHMDSYGLIWTHMNSYSLTENTVFKSHIDSYGLTWTLVDLYCVFSTVIFFYLISKNNWNLKLIWTLMDSNGLIWTTMGSRQMNGLKHHMRNNGIYSSNGLLWPHMHSYGLLCDQGKWINLNSA